MTVAASTPRNRSYLPAANGGRLTGSPELRRLRERVPGLLSGTPPGASSPSGGFASILLALFPCASHSTPSAAPPQICCPARCRAALLSDCSSEGQPAVSRSTRTQGQSETKKLEPAASSAPNEGCYPCSIGRTVKGSPSGDLLLRCCASALRQHWRGALCSQGRLHQHSEVEPPLPKFAQPAGPLWPLPGQLFRLCFQDTTQPNGTTCSNHLKRGSRGCCTQAAPEVAPQQAGLLGTHGMHEPSAVPDSGIVSYLEASGGALKLGRHPALLRSPALEAGCQLPGAQAQEGPACCFCWALGALHGMKQMVAALETKPQGSA